VVKAGGPELDKRKIEVPGHIKTVGSYVALVRLHPEVQAKLAFEVVKA
ncbi:MAG: 50S ribosomal protein L9, partial [Dermatophilaceae bacterium]|nr:50S ribosomal protein L9 [Dermatophilaceae bacterium]